MWNFCPRYGLDITSIKTKAKFAVLSVLSLFISSYAMAIPNPAPIVIESNKASYNDLARMAMHQGDVKMHQGSRRILADQLEVHRSTQGVIDSVKALGAPATFNGTWQDDKGPITGRADTITYLPEAQLIILDGNASLEQDGNAYNGPQIAYNLKDHLIFSEPAPDESSAPRTRLHLNPWDKS